MTNPRTRGDIYHGLLRAMGNYRFVDAITPDGETVHFSDENALQTIVTWADEGREPTVRCHHVWGVGGGPTDRFTGTRVRDRLLSFTGGEWTVISEKQVYPEQSQ